MDNPKLYSTSEAAQILGISKRQLNRLVNKNIIEPVQIDANGYRYCPAHIVALEAKFLM